MTQAEQQIVNELQVSIMAAEKNLDTLRHRMESLQTSLSDTKPAYVGGEKWRETQRRINVTRSAVQSQLGELQRLKGALMRLQK